MIKYVMSLLSRFALFLAGSVLLIVVLPATYIAMVLLAIPLLDLFLEWFIGRPNPHDAPWWVYLLCLVLLPLAGWLGVKLQKLFGLS